MWQLVWERWVSYLFHVVHNDAVPKHTSSDPKENDKGQNYGRCATWYQASSLLEEI